MAMDREKNICSMAETTVIQEKLAKLGISRYLTPCMAPGLVQE